VLDENVRIYNSLYQVQIKRDESDSQSLTNIIHKSNEKKTSQNATERNEKSDVKYILHKM